MKKKEKEEPRSRLESILDKYEKQSKDLSKIILLDTAPKPVPSISTGVPSVDRICGIGGFPSGRFVEVFGENSSGKTTLLLHAAAAVQRSGGVVAYVDAEFALDRSYADKLGVDVSKLLISQPDSGEQALDTAMTLASLMQTGDLIIIDSVAALVPQAEIDGLMGDQRIGLQAVLMSKALRKMSGIASRSGVTVAFINQSRSTIGTFGYGPKTTTSGGNALKFYASIRIEVKKTGLVKKGETTIGSKVKLKTIKNKVASPFREVETEIRFGQGIPKALDILLLSIDLGIVTKDHGILYGEEVLGKSLDSAYEALQVNESLMKELESKIKDAPI